ncbi:MAG: thiamine pyrophosphate-dependent enzyme [Bacteroidota bacterium]
MSNSSTIVTTGNKAAALMAYKLSEVCPIYPITPASDMSELVEAWSAHQLNNIFGSIPTVIQMQSEAGAAGVMHGALQTGCLATTFTASQGLLLMIPNMYKIAAQLMPNVIHVATRAIATHALSVFCDHSDIMAARQTGYAFLGASTVQEAHDFALLAHITSLRSRIPFVHFFDGFRTSHETQKIELISDEAIKSLLSADDLSAFRQQALTPDQPVLRGTSQGPDLFFQGREVANHIYLNCPDIMTKVMEQFKTLTGREYSLFEYVGHPQAEQVIVAMGSSTQTIENTVLYLNAQGERYGLVKVKLFRPFSTKHLLQALPDSCSSIAVLDRTKEPGSTGEPLFLDVAQSVMEAYQTGQLKSLPRVVGGRYGLGSREFTPAMVHAVFHHLNKAQPRNNFTVGIEDDVTFTSLDVMPNYALPTHGQEVLLCESRESFKKYPLENFYHRVAAFKESYVQGYSETTYDKAATHEWVHIRLSDQVINAPYLIDKAAVVACEDVLFFSEDSPLDRLDRGGTLFIQSELEATAFLEQLTAEQFDRLNDLEVVVFLLNPSVHLQSNTLSDVGLSHLQMAALSVHYDSDLARCFSAIKKQLIRLELPESKLLSSRFIEEAEVVPNTLTTRLLSGNAENVPLSLLPVDGTYPTHVAHLGSKNCGEELPLWDADSCVQCGACTLVCGTGALRMKLMGDKVLEEAPEDLLSAVFLDPDLEVDLLHLTIQANPDQCTSCNHCLDACPSNALQMVPRATNLVRSKAHWDFFDTIPEWDRTSIDPTQLHQQQLQEPLFLYPRAADGCGETPYLKLLSQLYGDRLLIANATGASSIFGGSLPATPWIKNANGKGPAWANSLFEDNAEFGLGYRLSLDQQRQRATEMLKGMNGIVDADLMRAILESDQNSEAAIKAQRLRVTRLKSTLKTLDHPYAATLLELVDSLVKKSVWIIGGDGWAHDIGYGGLDHVLASNENVNILVLDNEVYDNTGGQMSKATPFGATARFAATGKQSAKKDLGRIAMCYDHVYVASISLHADPEQALKAIHEAESYDGPSIVLAYCHSTSHGIDNKRPSQYHRAVVDSGQWLLYRHDPRNRSMGRRALQLDSVAPCIKMEEYMRMQGRFEPFFQQDNSIAVERLNSLQRAIDIRYHTYWKMAHGDVMEWHY